MKNIKKIPLIFSILSILTFFTPANAEIKVVASIKPIHSLASYIMDGVGSPDVIVDGYSSPHGFQLKPSHAKMLENADELIGKMLTVKFFELTDEGIPRFPVGLVIRDYE